MGFTQQTVYTVDSDTPAEVREEIEKCGKIIIIPEIIHIYN